MQAAVELDPLFVKALGLLHSSKKDHATSMLKQMMLDAIVLKKGKGSAEISSSKPTFPEQRSKESEKRLPEKKHHEPERSAIPEKKPKLDPELKAKSDVKAKSEVKARSDVKARSVVKSPFEPYKKETKERDQSVFSKETEVKEKPKEKGTLSEFNMFDKTKKDDSDTESTGSSSTDPGNFGMDAGDFAVDMGIACVVCRQFEVSSGNQLVECQECHSLYHQECHKPPVTNQNVLDPRFVWYCTKCQRNMKKLVSKPQKPKMSVAPPAPAPTVTTPTSSFSFLNKDNGSKQPTKSDSSIPFKRIDSVKTSVQRVSPTPVKPFVGLAGLAANLSGKDPTKSLSNLKSTETKSTKLSSSKSEKSSGSDREKEKEREDRKDKKTVKKKTKDKKR